MQALGEPRQSLDAVDPMHSPGIMTLYPDSRPLWAVFRWLRAAWDNHRQCPSVDGCNQRVIRPRTQWTEIEFLAFPSIIRGKV